MYALLANYYDYAEITIFNETSETRPSRFLEASYRDQIHLPREDATDEEVLLQRKELGTDYRYGFNVSLTYTFGSIYNNIVNPRFR